MPVPSSWTRTGWNYIISVPDLCLRWERCSLILCAFSSKCTNSLKVMRMCSPCVKDTDTVDSRKDPWCACWVFKARSHLLLCFIQRSRPLRVSWVFSDLLLDRELHLLEHKCQGEHVNIRGVYERPHYLYIIMLWGLCQNNNIR